ncbi:hypothetical protein TWF970_003011 [Orbilia oligospora]|uniref:Uncharacterized protein n=1 Tax=Orbilia oligospora TaxID=2813651 RepID=A0A7C8VQ79_ORBOL|nr:hypothetical protein TWF970_003011 [Orbilia oligospora]
MTSPKAVVNGIKLGRISIKINVGVRVVGLIASQESGEVSAREKERERKKKETFLGKNRIDVNDIYINFGTGTGTGTGRPEQSPQLRSGGRVYGCLQLGKTKAYTVIYI